MVDWDKRREELLAAAYLLQGKCFSSCLAVKE